jgi:hypothetical protein
LSSRIDQPANNPLHRTGESMGRAVFAPSAMEFRLGCLGAFVRQPVSRERSAANDPTGNQEKEDEEAS